MLSGEGKEENRKGKDSPPPNTFFFFAFYYLSASPSIRSHRILIVNLSFHIHTRLSHVFFPGTQQAGRRSSRSSYDRSQYWRLFFTFCKGEIIFLPFLNLQWWTMLPRSPSLPLNLPNPGAVHGTNALRPAALWVFIVTWHLSLWLRAGVNFRRDCDTSPFSSCFSSSSLLRNDTLPTHPCSLSTSLDSREHRGKKIF